MFCRILRSLRRQKKITQEELGVVLGVAKSTISMYENGKRTPDFEMMEKIADFFNVDMDFLRGKERTTNRLVSSLDGWLLPVPNTNKRPRLGIISCGVPIDSEQNFDGYDDVPDHINCDFTLLCDGDSMIGARIHDGDLVYIRQQPTVENGQIAAVLIDGTEKLLKRVYVKPNSIVLQAENPAYEPLFFVGEDMNRVSIIGRAVGFTSVLL